MRDLPSGATLLELGRLLLLHELLPLIPKAHRRTAHLVATAMAIAVREAMAGEAPAHDIVERLTEFYAEFRGAPQDDRCGRRDEPLLRCFAADLRRGAFTRSESQDRAARAILWRLTIAKLREGNPHFLAANGFR